MLITFALASRPFTFFLVAASLFGLSYVISPLLPSALPLLPASSSFPVPHPSLIALAFAQVNTTLSTLSLNVAFVLTTDQSRLHLSGITLACTVALTELVWRVQFLAMSFQISLREGATVRGWGTGLGLRGQGEMGGRSLAGIMAATSHVATASLLLGVGLSHSKAVWQCRRRGQGRIFDGAGLFHGAILCGIFIKLGVANIL